MRPADIQVIGDQLAIKWDDGSETFLGLEKMRRHCPCASCAGETDIMGNVYKGPDRALGPDAFRLVRLEAIVFQWNPASARVLEKCGYVREGILRRSAIKDGQIIDRWVYALVRNG